MIIFESLVVFCVDDIPGDIDQVFGVLRQEGIGTVTGFAITLGIGVILSMFTAIVITKFLLRNLVNIGIDNRAMFYNAKKKVGGAENE